MNILADMWISADMNILADMWISADMNILADMWISFGSFLTIQGFNSAPQKSEMLIIKMALCKSLLLFNVCQI